MIKKFCHTVASMAKVPSILFLFICALAPHSAAQSVQFSMDVQAELGIEVLQDLNFGTVIANSGRQRVGLGDPQMGIFQIKAMAAQSALLTLHKPDSLAFADDERAEKIPVSIEASYSGRPTGYNDVLNFANGSLGISLGNGVSNASNWETGYVFIYGDIDVGEVREGSYSGTLVLNITYQ
jgi:hypothetical protein